MIYRICLSQSLMMSPCSSAVAATSCCYLRLYGFCPINVFLKFLFNPFLTRWVLLRPGKQQDNSNGTGHRRYTLEMLKKLEINFLQAQTSTDWFIHRCAYSIRALKSSREPESDSVSGQMRGRALGTDSKTTATVRSVCSQGANAWWEFTLNGFIDEQAPVTEPTKGQTQFAGLLEATCL